jgi:predicted RNase H-like nuclease (RuvC/YqgF family)
MSLQEMLQMRDQINDLTSKNSELTSVNSELTSVNSELTSKNSELTSINKEMKSQNSDLEMSISELNLSMASLTIENNNLKAEILKKDSTISQANQEMQRLKAEIKSDETKVSNAIKLEETNRNLTTRLQEAAEKAKTLDVDYKKRLSQAQAQARDEVQKLAATVEAGSLFLRASFLAEVFTGLVVILLAYTGQFGVFSAILHSAVDVVFDHWKVCGVLLVVLIGLVVFFWRALDREALERNLQALWLAAGVLLAFFGLIGGGAWYVSHGTTNIAILGLFFSVLLVFAWVGVVTFPMWRNFKKIGAKV